MKFIKNLENKRLVLPPALLAVSEIEQTELPAPLEVHALEKTLVVLKGRMTALELLTAAWSLHRLAVELNGHLAKVCGFCDGCGGECPFSEDAMSDPKGSPLLGKLPETVLEMLREAGICLGELEEHLLLEDTVYGRKEN